MIYRLNIIWSRDFTLSAYVRKNKDCIHPKPNGYQAYTQQFTNSSRQIIGFQIIQKKCTKIYRARINSQLPTQLSKLTDTIKKRKIGTIPSRFYVDSRTKSRFDSEENVRLNKFRMSCFLIGFRIFTKGDILWYTPWNFSPNSPAEFLRHRGAL